jgi:hypothetical protein
MTTVTLNNLDYTLTMVLAEWLGVCYGEPTSATRKATVRIGITTHDKPLGIPMVNLEIVPVSVVGAGMGQCDSGKEFRKYVAHIRITTDDNGKGYAEAIGILQLGDMLMAHYRHATNGVYALANKGLRKVRLEGGTPSPDKNYHHRDYYLRFEVLI